MSKLRENRPTADILMVSMRAMGYSFESAIADIIDNSVSAGAHNVEIKFPIDPIDSYVAICDDGCGMSKGELFDAMKYGSEQKRNGRAEEDLGRFGLGLKAASLSQCRKLTVFSKKDGSLSAYVWDLDIIESQKDWLILELSQEQIENLRFINWLNDKCSGTVVLWENFDLIEKSSGDIYSTLVGYQNSVYRYISLIFHRYLNRVGESRLKIKINNCEVKGLDPFLENHNKTTVRKQVEIPVLDNDGIERIVKIQPFVLPFQKDLTEEDKELSGGIENYRSSQGFYIYRNERLIVWGKWFGRHRDELTKYARIRVDIPNALDDIWGIDIKKQSAVIPVAIRQRLIRAVDDVMDTSIKIQKYRGRIEKVDEKTDYIWDRIKERDEHFSYRINRDSKIFELLRGHIDDEAWGFLDMVLDEIEEAVPYQQIYIDKSQNKIMESVSDERMAEIEDRARILISLAMGMGTKARNQIIESLFQSEPFNSYPDLKIKLIEEKE